jgi:hypothetical protein
VTFGCHVPNEVCRFHLWLGRLRLPFFKFYHAEALALVMKVEYIAFRIGVVKIIRQVIFHLIVIGHLVVLAVKYHYLSQTVSGGKIF